MRFAFAGDRDLAVRVLAFALAQGHRPSALLVSNPTRASHASELAALVQDLPRELVITGDALERPDVLASLRALDLDLIIGIHFPYIIRRDLLRLPRWGFVNLHPAFLPYNRGWHTPSWAILDGTPYGATLHLMSEQLDTGDIIHQARLEVHPDDTADSLYARVKDLEFQVFCDAWPLLVAGIPNTIPQIPGQGTVHRRQELLTAGTARIDLHEPTTGAMLIDRLRALTTNRVDEAAWFERDGRRFRIQVKITEDRTDTTRDGTGNRP